MAKALLWAVILISSSCEMHQRLTEELDAESQLPLNFQTENVVVVVIDGPRFSETWGDPNKRFIPNLAFNLGSHGVHYNRFYNNGPTYTSSGHTAITTGQYQIMANDGTEFPAQPSLFQVYLNHTRKNPKSAQIITGKGKLAVLGDCSAVNWRGRFNPLVDAADRPDSLTFKVALEQLDKDLPNLVLIQFRGPDAFGHANDWSGYLNSISETDLYLWELWQFLQSHQHFSNRTTLFVTNDHGRHLDHISDGFVSHGDQCEGCMHINLFAMGPDFKVGAVINKRREQIDLAPTIAHLLGYQMPHGEGEILKELFKNN